MDFYQLAADRYSVRKFLDQPLKQEVLNQILNCGRIAPTGCNYQPQRVLVLNTTESMEKLKGCTSSHFDAPIAILVCYDKTETWVRKYDGEKSAPVDAGIVATHLMLMAQSLGVGSCMVMSFNPEKMREEFKLPETFEPSLLLVMGYPHPESVPHPLHNTRKPLAETVFYETFAQK